MTTTAASPTARTHTLILYGATSFVGQITARYLDQFLADSDISWAIAGRDNDKLRDIQKSLTLSSPEIVIANSNDAESLDAMTAQCDVIISTVGPYMNYGEALVKSCAQQGTDYVDLCGEALFIRDMIDKYQTTAQQTGARIINACGFDSIPSDLGVYFTQQQAMQQFASPCQHIQMRVKAAKGGLSGGTIASMGTLFAEVGQDKTRRRQLANPYVLNDDDQRPDTRQDPMNLPEYDDKHQRWQAPFIMAAINTRIVQRSNQLLNYQYGRDFKYDEAMWLPANLKGRLMSYGITAGMAGFALAMSFAPSRNLLGDYVLPKPGTGPTPEQQENGYFDLRFFGSTTDGQTLATKVTGDKDPGYGSTAQMLSQAALCLTQDMAKDKLAGGFWTPASAMGEALLERLQAHAGLKFETC